jgi:putative spermidine/putrescine transport system substrate-binding protein
VSGRRGPFISAGQRLDRRKFLWLASVAAGGLLLPGCRNDDDEPTPGPTATATREAEEVIVTAVAGYDNPAVWEGRSLTVTSWGGEYEDAQRRAIFEPFERLTGATIEVTATDVTELREMVENEETEWDVSDVLFEDVLPLANLGVLHTLDYNVIDGDGISAESRMEHGVASSYYSTLLTYRTDRWPELQPPGSWRDFWDIERYPGTRGLHRQPQGTLEFALLADGVALDELYPIDVPRALASLERILPSIALWWEQGAQPAQMVTAGDLDMTSAWHSRILRLQNEETAVEIQWNGGALSGDAWVIPGSAPNLDVAMDFINFATRPEVCAAFSTLVPFGPVNTNTFDLLPPEIVERLPTAPQHRDVQFMTNFEYWFQHREAVEAEFDDWMAEHP